MLRKQLPNGVVELRHGAQAQHATKWLMVRQTVQPHSKRLDVVVENSELAMAFELCEEAPSQQQVFAFLPLRRYGLRFIIQVSMKACPQSASCAGVTVWDPFDPSCTTSK